MGSNRRLLWTNRRKTFSPHTLPWRIEILELRVLLSAAFDVTSLTAFRADPAFAGIDGSGLSVAVLDTGLFGSHPDIQGNFIRFFDAVNDGQSAETNPGTAIASQSFDPPGEGHGTHVSGTVGSTNPEIGVATGTDLIGVRVLLAQDDSQPQVNPLVAGLQWVLSHQDDYNIRVVNMSLGSNTNFNSVPIKDDVGRLIDDLEARGVTVVTASGNSFGGFASLGTAYPSIFSTIAVANTWEDSGTLAERDQITLGQGNAGLFGVLDEDPNADQLSASSQRSSLPFQLAAPGTTIFSTWNGDDGLLFNTIAGTSMASPFVAGTVALMQDAAFTFGGRYLSPNEVVSILKSTADDIVDSQDPGTARFAVGNSGGQLVQTGPVQDLQESGLTFDRVNVHRALQEVRDFITGGTNPAPPPPDPGDRTDDTNDIITAATPVPNLNGLEQFEFDQEIGTDGNINVGPGDVDLFRIQLDSPGFPVFDLTPVSGGQTFTAIVRLFDQSGGQVTFENGTSGDPYPTLNTAQKLGTPLAAGTYFLGVSAAPNSTYNPVDGSGSANGASQGDYKLTITLSNPDPNGVVQGASNVDLTNPDLGEPGKISTNVRNGIIDSDPNPLTADSLPRIQVGAEDVDFFEIVAPDTGLLTIDIDARSLNAGGTLQDSFVAVYREDLTLVNSNDDEDFQGDLLDSLLTVQVTQGQRYFVAVTTAQNALSPSFSVSDPFNRQSGDPNAVGEYLVYFSFDNGDTNGTAFTDIPFTSVQDANGQAVGMIGADGGTPLLSAADNGGSKDVDFFSFTPTQPGLLQVDAVGESGFNAVIGLWSFTSMDPAELSAVADTNDSPSSVGLEIADALVGTELFISVTGLGNQAFNPFATGSGTGGQTGTYTLTVTQSSEQVFRQLTNNSIQNHTPETVSVGEPVRRDIGRDGTIDVSADDIDIYRFDSTFNGMLIVRTDTSDEDSADTFMRFFDAAGSEIAFNNNASDSTTASMLTVSVAAGQTYYIGINGASAQARAYNPLTGEGAVSGSEGHYTLTLVAADADQPTIDVSNAPAIAEILGQDAFAVFTVTLAVAPSGTVTVNYATADGTAAAGSDYIATNGTLTFAPGETSKTVSVPIIGDFTEEQSETFTLNLSGAIGGLIGDGQGTGTIANTTSTIPPMPIGQGQAVTVTNGDGTSATLSIKGPGTGMVFIVDENSGASRIELDGTTAATTLTLKGATTIGDIVVNGSLRSLGSKTVDLSGHLMVSGSVGKMTFDDITGATMSIGAGGSLTIAADQVAEMSIDSATPIKSMRIGEWLDSDDQADVLTAPSIDSLAVKRAFQADIIADVIGKVTVGGAVSGATVRADQIAGFTVGSIATSLIFAGVSGSALPDSPDDFTNPAGAIKAFAVKSKAVDAFSNTLLAAASLGKVSLGAIDTSNGGLTFGVSALTLKSVGGKTDVNGSFKQSNLDDPAGSLTVGDFVLRLL